VRVVKQAIQDRVPERGVSHDFVPVIDGHLAGEQGASATVAVVKHLEEIVAGHIVQRSEPPVIEDEQVGAGEALKDPGAGSVPAGEAQLVEEPREAEVADTEAVPTGLMSEGAGDVRLARSGGSDEEEALTAMDPLAVAESKDEGPVHAAGFVEVEVLKCGLLMEAGLAQETLEPPVGPIRLLPLEQEGETILEGEFLDVAHLLLFLEGDAHPGEPEFVKELEGGVLKHGQSPWPAPLGL
jgi:hypothetical protein